MHALDMLRRGLADGDLARAATRRGAIVVPVEASDDLRPGQAFLPMHWGSASLGGEAMHGINALTSAACCPQSGQPELKHAALRVTKAELPWRLTAFGYPVDGDALALRARLRALMAHLPFASVVLIGRERTGVLLRAAFAAPAPADVVAAIDDAFGLAGAAVARYDDARRGVGRAIRVGDGRIEAVRMAGDTLSESWLRDYLVGDRDVAALRTRLLSPGAQAPAGFVARGRVVCSCLDVAEADVRAVLAATPGSAQDALSAATRELKCGTHCGSCLPELRRLASEARGCAIGAAA
jgi:assimilatory nitrate reductase catalytic subunit